MADYITSDNLNEIVEQNIEIKGEINNKLLFFLERYNVREGIKSEEKLAFKILKQHGLIQMPIENQHWCGAIYRVGDKRVPVINTALPRVNQFFAAWHELYHLMFEGDGNEEVYQVSADLNRTERKADYFAAKALVGNVYNTYIELKNMEFMDKIAVCMDIYQVPYKAILIELYEEAMLADNRKLQGLIMDYFDRRDEDWNMRFQQLGLDEELVTPSYIVNFGYLEDKINEKRAEEPEVSAHELNWQYLRELKERVKNTMYGGAIRDERGKKQA